VVPFGGDDVGDVCNRYGMFSSGNINPVNRMDGTSMPIRAMSMAACCDAATLEIIRPRDSAVTIKSVLTKLPPGLSADAVVSTTFAVGEDPGSPARSRPHEFRPFQT